MRDFLGSLESSNKFTFSKGSDALDVVKRGLASFTPNRNEVVATPLGRLVAVIYEEVRKGRTVDEAMSTVRLCTARWMLPSKLGREARAEFESLRL